MKLSSADNVKIHFNFFWIAMFLIASSFFVSAKSLASSKKKRTTASHLVVVFKYPFVFFFGVFDDFAVSHERREAVIAVAVLLHFAFNDVEFAEQESFVAPFALTHLVVITVASVVAFGVRSATSAVGALFVVAHAFFVFGFFVFFGDGRGRGGGFGDFGGDE